MLHSMRETIGMNKREIGIWWRESPGMLVALIFYVITGAVLPYAGIYFFGTDHYGTGRSEKSGCSTQSGTALTRNRELVGTDLPLF